MSLLRQFSKAIMPALDRDLGRCIGKELSSMDDMVSNFLAPSVYGYEKAIPRGAFGATMKHNEPQRFIKVNYPIPQPGLFK
jgi:hypothetical protein